MLELGYPLGLRINHSSAIIENKILLFGGQGQESFQSNDLILIDIDNKNVTDILYYCRSESIMIYHA